MTELVLGKAGVEEGDAVAVGVDDCATRSADVKMGRDTKGSGGRLRTRTEYGELEIAVAGLLLAVVIGRLIATVTQLT